MGEAGGVEVVVSTPRTLWCGQQSYLGMAIPTAARADAATIAMGERRGRALGHIAVTVARMVARVVVQVADGGDCGDCVVMVVIVADGSDGSDGSDGGDGGDGGDVIVIVMVYPFRCLQGYRLARVPKNANRD